MDYRPLIRMAGVLASHAKIIDQKFPWHKHFSYGKRKFLCIKLRDLHSLSAIRPQLSPQRRGVRLRRGIIESLSRLALT
jgi:hypothetical protein